ncbi:MAG: hypothetical protein WKF81_08125 [Thermomicrobiales bacterium]
MVALAMFVMAFAANLDHIDGTAFHPDESRWLNRAYFVDAITDPYGFVWQDYYLTRGQPPLGSYVIGLGQLVQGTSLNPNLVWDFFYGASNWNQISGAAPDEENLESGRRTSAFIGALAVVTAYYITRRMTNRLGGFAAAFLIAWNGLSIRIGSQALSDQTLLLTLGLVFLAAFQMMKRPTWPCAIVLGICFGLGGSAKLTPLLLSLAAAGIGGLLLIRFLVIRLSPQQRKLDRSIAIKLILQPVIAFVAFVATYPYLWSDPIRRSWNLYNFRINEMDSQGRAFPSAKVNGFQDVFNRINNNGNLGGMQQTSARVIDWFNSLTGREYGYVLGLDLLIAAASLPFVLLIAMRYGLRSPHFLVSTLLGAEAALIVLGLRSDLYRYYLPLVFIMFICVGIMVGMVSGWLGRKVASLFHRRQDPLPFDRAHRTSVPTRLNSRVARYRRSPTRLIVIHRGTNRARA